MKNYKNPKEIFEKEQQNFVYALLQKYKVDFKKDFFIDIGAHRGWWVIFLGKKFKNILAIEASPENWEHLEKKVNKKLSNKKHNIFIIKKAAFDGSKEKVFIKKHHSISKDPYWKGMRCYINNDKGEFEVEAEKVDDIYEEINGFKNKVSFIKMDIEGFEPVAFSGMEKIVKKYRPILFFEIEKRWIKRASRISKKYNFSVKSFRNYICEKYNYKHVVQDNFLNETIFLPK